MVVGVDIGSQTQYARAFNWRGIEISRKAFKFKDCGNGYAQFRSWLYAFQSEKGLDKVIVGVEPTGHYWFGLANYLESTQIQLVLVTGTWRSRAYAIRLWQLAEGRLFHGTAGGFRQGYL